MARPGACRATRSNSRGWLRRLVRHQNPHHSIKPRERKPDGSALARRTKPARALLKTNQYVCDFLKPKSHLKCTAKKSAAAWCLTKKAEPPPTRGVNRDSGTASANGGWLRRLVRRRHNDIQIIAPYHRIHFMPIANATKMTKKKTDVTSLFRAT